MNKKNKYILLLCLKFAKTKLGITKPFKLKLSSDREEFTTYAHYNPSVSVIAVYVKNRALADCMRSVIHELVHHMQNQAGKIKGQTQDIGGDIENEANAKSGEIIKEFGYKIKEEKDIDIYSL